jgi:hypothetical protein
VGLACLFLRQRKGRDAMFLPETFASIISENSVYFNRKSAMDIYRKVLRIIYCKIILILYNIVKNNLFWGKTIEFVRFETKESLWWFKFLEDIESA